MSKKFKKLLCGFISAAMLISTLPAMVSAEDAGGFEPLFYATFDEVGTGSGSFTATTGGTISEHGSIAYADSWNGESKALSISTNAAGNYLELPKGILNGYDEATFSFWIKPSSGWAFMTTPVSGAQDYLKEKYLGMLASATYTAERYNNSGTRLSSVIADASADWQYVAIVFEANSTKLYINGRLAASDKAAVDIKSLFTADASTWIGHGNWGDGEGFSGLIDDFAIYGGALSDSQVAAISAEGAEYERQKLLSENNCYIADTHFYSGNTEIFASSELNGDLTITTSVSNYTINDGEVTVTACVSGNESDSKIFALSSGETKDVTFNLSGVSGKDTVTVELKTPVNGDYETNTAATLYGGVKAPVKAPADSDDTTFGAHDPSIVKFPNDDTYYVYSSHHLIYTSTDLVNWKEHDFTNINAKVITPETYRFISANYSNTTMNGTYWAPDVIYREGDDHPYWMYISVSCGLGGRNSAISLMKSDSPMFWADKNADIVDAGIVFATKEANGYKTNAIDANIYVDSNNGKEYFVWGSFWGGIQAAPLTAEGRVEGINYTSDATILSSCASNFGTSVFTQKDGVAGPEGAWMIEHGDYRYMFTSYGWLGSNYNTRLARAPLSTPFSTNMGTQLVDANGVVMGTQQSKGSLSGTTGYKVIGSYRLGDGSMTIATDGANAYVPYSAGDAHIYYGPGHNSAINVGDESFYVSHARKDYVEGAAYLQVRKMLWTEDGWPVVSPVTYAGEVEQALPIEMLYGTYDLASVGRTKMIGTTLNTGKKNNVEVNRNYDLPVLSSKVTLNADSTMTDSDGEALGTWEFDGDHKITLTFTANGTESLDEFYKSGDVMTMYALFGYDKDEAEPVIALTGVDQNHVTQLAKKALANTFRTKPAETKAPIIIEKSAGGNPILGFDNNGTAYAGDPAAMVDGDTVYLYAGHDTATTETYVMPEWLCYSSKDMENWKYEGVVMKATDISWRNDNNSAWASQAIKYGDKYYLYYCTWTKTDGGRQSIGVAVSDSPTGPFKDPLGKPLVAGSLTEPQSGSHDDIDPTVWVETVDGVEHRYLCWGNTRLRICELNEDMISVKDLNGDGQIKMNDDIIEQTITGAPAGFTEAPWLYRRQDENGNYYGQYYLFYAMGWREQMAYATTDNLLGKTWEYGGLLMPPSATANTNHPSVIDFNGKTYFIYHNGALPWGSGFRRSVCVEEFTINEDGTIDPIQETSIGLTGTASHITQGNDYIVHENFVNPGSDGSYPLIKSVSVGRAISDVLDTEWEIMPGKADAANEYYVSIQSVNKPGLYLAAQADGSVILTQDSKQNDTAMRAQMTFKTLAGINGDENGVTFESVSQPGYYLANAGGALVIVSKTQADADACTFNVSTVEDSSIEGMLATITNAWHNNEDGLHFYLNNAVLYGAVSVFAAEYDNSGMLLGVSTQINVPVISLKQSFSLDYERKSDTSTLKVLVWRDMEPVAEPVTVTDTENPYQIPEGYTSYFEFEQNLKDSVSGAAGTVAPGKITGTTTASAAYADGYNGSAVSLTGNGGTGINLGKVITNSKYTIAFRMKANSFTQFTSGVFINSGDASNQKWVSAPFGSMTDGNTMVWSNNGGYVTLDSNGKMVTDKWHHVAIAADGGKASLYIDGVKTGSGDIANIVTSSTDTYLGVNFWDTPFNGLIDDLYIYNGTTLSDNQVTSLFEATNK